MPAELPYLWKQLPFVRLIIPLMIGIAVQFYFVIPLNYLLSFLAILLLIFIASARLPLNLKYTLRWLPGMSLNLIMCIIGALLIYQKDIKNNEAWIVNHYRDSVPVLATLNEPLVEKEKSYKAEARIEAVRVKDEWIKAKGTILIYFSKDSVVPKLNYGSQVLFTKPLQEIKNSGNPGNFNYKQFNAFKDIYHQVFLKSNDYLATGVVNKNGFQQWLYNVRDFVIAKLEMYIHDEREAGVAEALLIGYRDNLDKGLVQAYSNTGVVHIIAISGLHLGMIYGMLVFIFRWFKKYRWNKLLRPIVILLVLWVFTFLAGAAPSILRSAVMFSFILLGELINRKSSIYNTLAASAFVILCMNPFYLWDIGFQLSYIAVISIVTFSKPIYNWIYIKNKSLNFLWQMTSVTIAAQILTMPIIFYSFHQFPNLFLITNCLIVPLSSLILFAELAVVITSFVPVVAKFIGLITSAMLRFMNWFIETMSSLHFSVYDQIQNSIVETWLLFIVIISFCYWLMRKSKPAFFVGLFASVLFLVIDSLDASNRRKQKKIIVYNVPKETAIDFIDGNTYSFIGDSIMKEDGYLRNFHLKPARTLYKVKTEGFLSNLFVSYPFIQYYNKRIALIDKPYRFNIDSKISVDFVVISKSPRIRIAELADAFDCKDYVFDGSNSFYKIKQWKKDCDSLHLRHHIASDKGAFEVDL